MLTDYVIADAIRWAEEYTGEPFHAILCDPPYHLTTITKRFGKKGSAPAKFGKDGAFARASRGFMGQQWDGGEIAFQPETWHAFGKLLYPGAFGMAFASSRGYHRLAVAIEDSGMVLHPAIGWLQSQGMPKATNISKVIDRQNGVDEEILKKQPYEPATDLAKAWVGHRYGLQSLKPTLEFICVFQKPYEGKPLDCITQTGAGALNIDAARIPTDPERDDMLREVHRKKRQSPTWENGSGFKNETNNITGVRPEGRWPTNFILDAEAAGILDEQSGMRQSGKSNNNAIVGEPSNNIPFRRGTLIPRFDSGGASRFFFNVQAHLDDADPVRYCPKAAPSEREAGLEGMEDKLYAQSGGAQARLHNGDKEYKQDSMGMNRIRKVKNPHPTVKPIKLNEYLAKLLLPPDIYAPRRIFVPFAGVSSEMIGAGLAGWDEIVGIELDSEGEYAKIAQARLDYWLRDKPRQLELLKK